LELTKNIIIIISQFIKWMALVIYTRSNVFRDKQIAYFNNTFTRAKQDTILILIYFYEALHTGLVIPLFISKHISTY